jgi:hypothetical protein
MRNPVQQRSRSGNLYLSVRDASAVFVHASANGRDVLSSLASIAPALRNVDEGPVCGNQRAVEAAQQLPV